jgi:hypothetical protein
MRKISLFIGLIIFSVTGYTSESAWPSIYNVNWNTQSKLINLPDEWQSPIRKERWKEMLNHLPSLPIGNHDGKFYMQPAENIPNNWHTHSPEMLLQTHGGKLYILPGWPADWDVDFKLMAPHQTMVSCSYRSGKIREIIVYPAEREKDIVLPAGLQYFQRQK